MDTRSSRRGSSNSDFRRARHAVAGGDWARPKRPSALMVRGARSYIGADRRQPLLVVVLASLTALLLWLAAIYPAHAQDLVFADAFEAEPAAPASDVEAARFLNQATFGATPAAIAELRALGYRAWIERQLALPMSRSLPYVQAHPAEPDDAPNPRLEAWYLNAVEGEDQLRQRMAFALSEIFVVSDRADILYFEAQAMAQYYDLLSSHAFGNYRALLEAVTLHPVMGAYLSMLGNRGPAPGIRPDENYAREILQLFSIGLWQLNPDGSYRLDAAGARIPTYDQDVIRGFAHAFTGWNFADCDLEALGWEGCTYSYNWLLPMQAYPDFHDVGEKRLLDGVRLPPGRSAQQDLSDALDLIAAHPNVGPFISRQLIQRLVTSNPSPAYVARIARVFADNGAGTRGDLGAVARAILLDPEARYGERVSPQRFGKAREPLLKLTHIWRAFHGRAASGRYAEWYPEYALGQAPLRAPSVFNFFQPGFAPPGPIADAGLVAPEFQIFTTALVTSISNDMLTRSFYYVRGIDDPDSDWVLIDVTREAALAADPPALADHLDVLLLGGAMSPTLRRELIALVNDTWDGDAGRWRALEALNLVLRSPDFAVQR
jgi:uncharacterized protein (DUF1800 family)